MPHGGKASTEEYMRKRRLARREFTKQAKKAAKAARRAEATPKTAPMARPPLVIPTVTEDDLLAFQLFHFGDDTRPDTFFVDPHLALEPQPAWQEYDEDDDGLGWYEDGVKRTLTDEQIVMFRHSEMMGLTHRSAAATNEKIDQQDAATAPVFERGGVDHYSPESSLEELAELATDAQPKPKKSKRPKKSKQKRPSLGSRSDSTRLTSGPPAQRPRRKDEVPYDMRHKRKWEDFIEDNDPDQGSMTHRRLVRELDEQKIESFDMDY